MLSLKVQEAASGSVFVQMPDVWINLAHVYFAQGNFALAVKMVIVFISYYLFIYLCSQLIYISYFCNSEYDSTKIACGSSITIQMLKFCYI